jgi:hypothetical protein
MTRMRSPKPIIYFLERSQQVQVHYAKTRWTRDHRPGPTSSPSIPVLDQHFGVVDHSISSPTQQHSNGPGLARPKPFCCSPQGMKMGFDPPGRL